MTDTVLGEVEHHSAKVGDLISEISAASKEQAQGIDQLNQAATEMDRVTQENSSGAEESAAAAEQMRSQADELKMLIQDLQKLVKGANNKQEYNQRGNKPTLPQDSASTMQKEESRKEYSKEAKAALPLDDDAFFSEPR
jgi:methyl-accepting chemotaxis protein